MLMKELPVTKTPQKAMKRGSCKRDEVMKSLPVTENEGGFCVGDLIKIVKTNHKHAGKEATVKKVTRCRIYFEVKGVRHEVLPYLGKGSIRLVKAAKGTELVRTANGDMHRRQ